MPVPFQLILNVTGLTEIGERLALLAHDSSERREIFLEVLNRLGQQLVFNLASNTPHGVTQKLATSTDYNIIEELIDDNLTEYSLIVTQDAFSPEGFVYRPIVVHGRGPGKMPPALALRGWVALKWGLDTVQAGQAASRLAVHIGRHGTAPNDYVEKTIIESQEILELAANSLGQALVAVLNNPFLSDN